MEICSDRLVPRGFDAITVWPVIFVRPEHRHDQGLIEHERVHLREQQRTVVVATAIQLVGVLLGCTWLHEQRVFIVAIPASDLVKHLLMTLLAVPGGVALWWLLYVLSPWHRLHAEVRAYRRQVQVRGITAWRAAELITSSYRLKTTFAEAYQLITNQRV